MSEPRSTAGEADGWEEAEWKNQVLSHMPAVERQLPTLSRAVEDPRGSHGEIRQAHELLLEAERTTPRSAWGAPLEGGWVGQRYGSAVRELRWSAELLLWALKPETTDEVGRTYLRDARYHLRIGESLLERVRAALTTTENGKEIPGSAEESGTSAGAFVSTINHSGPTVEAAPGAAGTRARTGPGG